ncbi:MAG: glutathione S-transferase [Methylovirgula sp.]|nr:glutathione S-transferase [Methylovirgula sp.]
MRLYDYPVAPNCRRVRIFLAEKGVSVPSQMIDLSMQEQLSSAYRAINPRCTVPALQLDDGTLITEVLAIWRYFEETDPEPPLLGRDAKDKALVTMWERRMELDGFLPGMDAVRNFLRSLKSRALTGPRDYEQIPELIERGKMRLADFFQDLDGHLSHSPFVAGAEFTAADITGFVALDFVAGRLKLPIPDDQIHLRRWSERVAARPSFQL